MHPRAIIRNAVGAHLRAVAPVMAERVFVQREVPLQSVNELPAIAVFTRNEITVDKKGYGRYRKELPLEVQIYVRRQANQVQPARAVNYQDMADSLDALCEDVERGVIHLLAGRSVAHEGESVSVMDVTDISTEFDSDSGGSVPHSVAIVRFSVVYDHDVVVPLETCAFEFLGATFSHLTCDPDDPSNGQPSISVGVVL